VTAPNPEPSDRYYGYSGYPEQNPEPTTPYAYPEDTAFPAAARAPRPRRRGRRWIIALVILLGLLVAADRIGVVVTENVLASQIKKDQNLSQTPGVSIDGFPFLTQVVSRDFSHVTVDIRGLVASGVPISDIHADLNGVHVSSGYNSATVDTLTATAILNYSDLSKAISNQVENIGTVTVSEGSGGQLKATYSILGASVSAQVAATLLPGNTIELKSAGVDAGGLGGLVQAVTPTGFDVKIPLGTLPFGIQLKSLVLTSTAADIIATGHNVALSQTTATQQ
jgi:LmeA-like phospholipid-binding